MNEAAGIGLVRFGSARDPLVVLERARAHPQVQYLRCYLADLGARTLLIEANYFDRDYLSEFEAFYATTSVGYPNVCRRVHAFATNVTRAMFEHAVGGDLAARRRLQEAYLGHIVLRPLPEAPVGRTVLTTYQDPRAASGTPRIMNAARRYEAHVAGLTLAVHGLAWQQQDSAVGACATIAMWSMLHSSAFDDHHAIPTTADITRASVPFASKAATAFPANDGMHLEQVCDVIRAHGLSPVIISGLPHVGFERRLICPVIGSFLRSGYPILAYCEFDDQASSAHAVCLVGFRSPPLSAATPGELVVADTNIEHVYVHDDNLGPNTRFRVDDDTAGDGSPRIVLRADAPPARNGGRPTTNPSEQYATLIPTDLVVAVHPDLRTSPGSLERAAIRAGEWLPAALELAAHATSGMASIGVTVSTRFVRLVDYLDRELGAVLGSRPQALAATRLALCERIPPMARHVGIVRLSAGSIPWMDVLYDTSDNDRHLRPRAHVVYQRQVEQLTRLWSEVSNPIDLGVRIRAW